MTETTRETRTFTTSSGKEVKIKTYFTQRERAKIQMEIAGDSTANNAQESTKISDVMNALETAVKIAVVSVDGKTDYEKLLFDCMPANEYDEVAKEVMAMLESFLGQTQ